MVQKRPPGNRVRTREHLHARRRADEGRRVYERGDEPAGAWVCGRVARRRSTLASSHCTGPFRPGRWLAGRGREGEGAPAWVWERAWARGPLATEGSPGSLPHGRAAARAPAGRRRGGARESAGGSDREGVRGGQLAEEHGGVAGERAGGRTRWGRGEREGAWATVAGDSPVGSGVDQLAVGGWHGRENTRDQGPPRGVVLVATGAPRWGGGRPGCRGATAAGECTVSCW